MTLQEFRDSLLGDELPRELSPTLAALWWDVKGDWNRAHESAQQDEGPAGAWVHAYLHRKEGDASNAGYWYQRAGKSSPRRTLEEEWRDITESLIGSASGPTVESSVAPDDRFQTVATAASTSRSTG